MIIRLRLRLIAVTCAYLPFVTGSLTVGLIVTIAR